MTKRTVLTLALVAGCGGGSSDGADGGVRIDGVVLGDGEGLGHDSAPGTWWKPSSATPITWHWQLTGDFVAPRDVLPDVTVYDIDGETTSAETVAALHALGPDVKVICYFDAGVYESYRGDAQRFIDAGLTDGPPDLGWDDSWWIDIRKLDVLMPILRHRMEDWCVAKGFDAIEPDETEVWANWNEQRPEDPITRAENDAFNRAVADMAHELNLSVGLKGNNTEAAELAPLFDWALTEECWNYEECEFFRDGFASQGKAVFNVEYEVDPDCAQANAWHLNSSRRDLDLVGPTDGDYRNEPCLAPGTTAWP